MEVKQTAYGYEISDIGIASGLLCAVRIDEEGRPVIGNDDKPILVFSYGGLKRKSKGSGYLFIVNGNPELIRERINDWFVGKSYGDYKAFSEKSKFLKAEIFDTAKLAKALNQGEQQKGKLENGNTIG